ncbi:sensor histidine kinase [Sphingomonas psychrotolerans]|uniref:sensor histidine kinase n=1 Tax=Sphingomonas psychrotolerans TaxID=1327635 RepID=UPI00130518AD|nr:HAMP domain-containing sensor histidine kinase [Sphingomonas psychrotolerans]
MSIFSQVAGLALLVLLVAMGISFALALAIPAPTAGQMNIEEMVWALEAKPSWVIETDVRTAPPVGRRSPLVEASLAAGLRVDPANVRAIWVGEPQGAAGTGESILLVGERDVLVRSSASGVKLRSGDDAAVSRLTLLPLFTGAVRLNDGNWRWGIPDDPVRTAWRWRILAAFVIATVLLSAPVWLIARRIVAPVEQLGRRAASSRMAGEDPFALVGPLEVRATARAMNGMHNRLVAQAAERVRLIAAIAHDLRTPITALRLRANAIEEPLRGRMSSDLSRLSSMIGEMLDFAAIGGRPPQLSEVDLFELLRTLVAGRVEAGDDVAMTTGEPIILVTDRDLLNRAVENLIDNAVKYGGQARISLIGSLSWAVIRIDDTGPGIPDDSLAEAIKPFERLDASRTDGRTGTGLGLSIVHDIARVLGARFELRNRSPGLSATLMLPRS